MKEAIKRVDTALSLCLETRLLALLLLTSGIATCVAGERSAAEVDLPRLTAEGAACQFRYPSEAKNEGQEGTVVLRTWVDVNGRVPRAEVAVSSGFPLLDKAALDGVACLRYRPGRLNGTPTPMWVKAPFKFEMGAPRRPAPPPVTSAPAVQG